MKNLAKLIGITVFIAVIVVSMAGCDLFKSSEFPSEFKGTWERAFQSSYTNTLTFTSDTLKASNQSCYWILTDASGDSYTIEQSDNRDHKVTEVIKFVNGNLEISGDPGSGQDNWNGSWKRR